MNLRALLGSKLKDDGILEVLEAYQIEKVVYDFDRHHENIEDVYWAAATSAGFLLRFDQHQMLDTIFCYMVAEEGFSPISPQIIGAPIYRSFDEAEAACKTAGLRYSVSDPKNGPRFHRLWLRIEGLKQHTHYQFKGGEVSRITLMRPGLV
jgi:hypothetical protein